MTISAGILCFRKRDNIEFFMCSPGGVYWKNRVLWNFPKGHVEDGESALEAAFREFSEETSISLKDKIDISNLLDFGEIKQNAKKRVHLFAIEFGDINPDECYSITSEIEYPPKSGEFIEIEEIGKYAWLTLEQIRENGMKVYFPIFEQIINNYDSLKRE